MNEPMSWKVITISDRLNSIEMTINIVLPKSYQDLIVPTISINLGSKTSKNKKNEILIFERVMYNIITYKIYDSDKFWL